MKNYPGFFALIIVLSGFLACTDVIDVELDPAETIIVVDAWLTDQSKPQNIRLTQSLPYFEDEFTPGVEGAQIILVRNAADTMQFLDEGNGNYTWTPEPGEKLGGIGDQFYLGIALEGEFYLSQSEIRRVTQIDSLVVEYRTDELAFPDGFYASMFARDLAGIGDTYWIKAYKNGLFLNKPQELNLAYDAGFDPGGEVDGIIFIPPIREAINRFPDPDTEDDFEVPPYEEGDEVHVEIHSITPEAFFFLQTARDQMTNGDNTIFSIPLANTKSNVLRQSDMKPVLGFFCVSAVSEATEVIQ